MAARTPARRPRPASPVLGAATALIGQAGASLVTQESRFRHSFEAPVDRIRREPNQPRKVFDEADIASLAATMAEQGQLQPVLLRRDPEQRGAWILVAGERRWRAARLNGWPTILAIEHDGDPEVAGLLENLQRVDLTPVEEARGLQRLIEGKHWTQTQAAEALGKSKGEISATLRILSLPDEVLTSELGLPRNVLVELGRVEDPSLREELLRLARSGGLTVRAIRDAREAKERQTDEAAAAPSQDPAPAAPSGRGGSPLPRLSGRAVDRIAETLRALREAGGPVGADDRRRLESLRLEIDALLAEESHDAIRTDAR